MKTHGKGGVLALALAFCTLSLSATHASAAAVELQMYYPVAVGGGVSKIVDGMVQRFEAQHPEIKISPVYTGDYATTITKALTAYKGGTPPQIAVIGDIEVYSLIDAGAIQPVSDLAQGDDGKAWLDSFYPAFMRNIDGKTWGVPFQRSTIVMYWNKDAFQHAGLDPEQPPQNWDEVVEFGKKLTTEQGPNGRQWGIEVPSNAPLGYWLLQGFSATNGGRLDNGKGTAVNYAQPETVEALTFMRDLSVKEKVSPTGTIAWSTTPQDFLDSRAAMIVTTTGNLGAIRQGAKFPFGIAMLPEKAGRGSPTGGGNLYVFSKISPEQRDAATTFIRWLTEPEQAAEWSIATGYVATSPAAWETSAMQDYVKQVPQSLVAREQLQYAQPELATYENSRVQDALNQAVEAVVTGAKEPKVALEEAQRQADRILRRYQ